MLRLFAISLLLVFVAKAIQACPEFVWKADWGARAVPPPGQMKMPVPHVFIHHTAGAKCSNRRTCSKVARQTQNLHINNQWGDIGYSFLVGGDGRIYEGRGWKGVGAHTINYNSNALAISFMGNFDKKLPKKAMIDAARKLIDCGVKEGHISKDYQLHGHRDASCTACPGEALYRNVKTWPNFVAGKLPGYAC